QQLGHGGVDAQPLGNGLAVAAVGAGEVIIAAYGPAAAHGRGFLPHTRVERAADLALLVQVANGFFEFTDDEHLPVSIRQPVGGQWHSASPIRVEDCY